MALYAFDGTWNEDEKDNIEETNVKRFAEIYQGNQVEYIAGVGTRYGTLGKILGGIFGAGGKTRIDEMYEELCENMNSGDLDIDIIGFSRGAALAVHFAHKIGEDGVTLNTGEQIFPKVRFLGIWDIVGSFGLAVDCVVDFQKINLGWHIDQVHQCVDQCYHAMALDERRETFNVTRLDPEHQYPNIQEVWFRGVHSDIGGGNKNVARSNIALNWMLDRARECHLPMNEATAARDRYSEMDPYAPIYQNLDFQIDDRRKVFSGDEVHHTAPGQRLEPGQSHTCTVASADKFNWAGVAVAKDEKYAFQVTQGATWKDAGIECGPDGWPSEDLPWYKQGIVELLEPLRRVKRADWFTLCATINDEDENAFAVGSKTQPFSIPDSGELYLFANDLHAKYGNNSGAIEVTVTRVA